MPRRSTTASIPQAFEQARKDMMEVWYPSNDYYAGQVSRYRPEVRGTAAHGAGADFHYRNERQWLRMIERGRDFDRNNMIVRQGINRLLSNIFPECPSLSPTTGDKSADGLLREAFYDWADDCNQCDLERDKNFWQIGDLNLRASIVDGDSLVVPLKMDCLQTIEAHRLRTPSNTTRNVVQGILLDNYGRRRQAWITKEDLGTNAQLKNVSDVKPIDWFDEEGYQQVFQIYEPDRYSQRRGVSKLAPACDALHIHDDIQFATLVKAQVSSYFALIEKVAPSHPYGDPPPDLTQDDASATGIRKQETWGDGSSYTTEELQPGARVRSRPGVDLEGFAPNIPSPQFFPHSMMILTFIAVNLEIPVAVLLLDPSNTNFSGWRGAIDQARGRFKKIQQMMFSRYYTPVYQWRLRMMAKKDPTIRALSASLGKKFFSHVWNPPAWRYIEPLKDSSDALLRARNGMDSRRRIAAERGIDYADQVEEIIEDNSLMISRAYEKELELKAKYPGIEVSWMQIANSPTPDGIQIGIQPATDEAQNQPAAKDKKTND